MSITKDCQTHAERVVAVFTRADCWALALELAERYEDLTIVILGTENVDDGVWCHMLVRDDRDPNRDTFVDVLGTHTFEEIQEQWDEFDLDEWDGIYPLDKDEVDAARRTLQRYCPEITVDEGIDQILATGWTPPPARTH